MIYYVYVYTYIYAHMHICMYTDIHLPYHTADTNGNSDANHKLFQRLWKDVSFHNQQFRAFSFHADDWGLVL